LSAAFRGAIRRAAPPAADSLRADYDNDNDNENFLYGAVRQFRALEWCLGRLVPRMPKGETPAALLAGAQQILFMSDVPDYAAVHATVEAAKRASPRSAGLVDALLQADPSLRVEAVADRLPMRDATDGAFAVALSRDPDAGETAGRAAALCARRRLSGSAELPTYSRPESTLFST
jgi:hypothetical protein